MKTVQVNLTMDEAMALHKALETFDGAATAIRYNRTAGVLKSAAADLENARGPLASLRESLDTIFHKGG